MGATFSEIACANTRVGDVELRGRFGGAVCSYWRVVGLLDGFATYAPVESVSIQKADGTLSQQFEAETLKRKAGMLKTNYKAYLDGKEQVYVVEFWPDGSTTLAFPYYVVIRDGGERCSVAATRMHARPKK